MLNISFILKVKNDKHQDGQSLVEFLICFLLILLISFGVIEIARLVAFKNELQASTSYAVHEIAIAELNLPENNLEDQVSKEIQGYLNLFSTGLFSFAKKKSGENHSQFLSINKHLLKININLLHDSSKIAPGVYLEVQTCLPVLFSSYFNSYQSNIKLGRVSKIEGRDCLGLIHHEPDLPNHWFRLRVAAYSPWPVTTEVLKHGIGVPQEFNNIDSKSRSGILEALQNEKLSDFF